MTQRKCIFSVVDLIELCDFLTVNWERIESLAIDRPRCLTGIVESLRDISARVEFD